MGQGSSSSSSRLGEGELQLMRHTMQIAMKDAEGVGSDILGRFLEHHKYKQYFRKFADVADSELRNNEGFKAHSLKVIKAIDNAVSHANQLSQLKTDLFHLGAFHGSKRVTEKQFLEIKTVILEYFVERFKLPPEAVDAWGKAFDIGPVEVRTIRKKNAGIVKGRVEKLDWLSPENEYKIWNITDLVKGGESYSAQKNKNQKNLQEDKEKKQKKKHSVFNSRN